MLMSFIPTGPPVVKEFKFFPDYVKVVFQDNRVEDFYGSENIHLAQGAVVKSSSEPKADLPLTDQNGDAVIMIVTEGVQAFRA